MDTGHWARQGIRACRACLAWALLSAVFNPVAHAGDWTYRVRPGDTLWDLAATYLKPGHGWQQLQTHNRIADPFQLPPGQSLRVPITWLRAEPARARIVAVHGAATIQLPGQPPGPATPGQRLPVGSLVETGANASLGLQFADGSRLLLRGGSQLRLDRLTAYAGGAMADTRLRLQRGRITNTVRKQVGNGAAHFQITTPTATSAVRGTVFRIDADASGTRAEVLQGSVAVSSGKRDALLRRGYGTSVGSDPNQALRPVKLLPAPDLSGWAPLQRRARPQLAWPAVAGASGYQVKVSASSDFSSLLVDQAYASPQAVLPPLGDGVYAVRVSAVDARGLEGHDATARLSVEALPEPPYTLAPAAATTTHDARPELQWSAVTDAAGYQVQLAADPDFATPLASATPSETRFRPQQPLAAGQYYWRVASRDDQGRIGPYGDAVPFAYAPLPEVGELGRERGERGAMTFRWAEGDASLRYRFQMSRSADFSRLEVDRTVDEPQLSVPKLKRGTWYVRAQAIGADGYAGPFPPAQVVEVPCRACRIAAGAGIVLLVLAL